MFKRLRVRYDVWHEKHDARLEVAGMSAGRH
jgi:hypothetical protein